MAARLSLFALATLALCNISRADNPNYHLVGWANVFLPGAGQALLGNPALGAAQAGVEISTFAWGYSLSLHSPMTLDGVPEQIPPYQPGQPAVDLSRELYADWLQEAGLKLHMVDVYDAYRTAAAREGATAPLDQTPVLDLFLAPFDPKNLADPWVAIPLGLAAAAISIDFFTNQPARTAKLTPYSNFLYGATYAGVYPIGSGAPEEMFYRGFLQSELEALVPSPWFSIPLSTAAYTFSHGSWTDRESAAVTGLYLGYLAWRNPGDLKPGITFHFWADFLAGLESILLANLGQASTAPITVSAELRF